ncbi:hypothetical protein AgCh_004910 [Apium graveolens]
MKLEISRRPVENTREHVHAKSKDVRRHGVTLKNARSTLEISVNNSIKLGRKPHENSEISISQNEDMKMRDLDKPNSLIENSETSISQTTIEAKSESKQIKDLERMNTQKLSSIKIPTFDRYNYALWKKKMMLFARMANPLYIQILKNGPFTLMVRVEESTDGDMVILTYYAPKDPSEYTEPEKKKSLWTVACN